MKTIKLKPGGNMVDPAVEALNALILLPQTKVIRADVPWFQTTLDWLPTEAECGHDEDRLVRAGLIVRYGTEQELQAVWDWALGMSDEDSRWLEMWVGIFMQSLEFDIAEFGPSEWVCEKRDDLSSLLAVLMLTGVGMGKKHFLLTEAERLDEAMPWMNPTPTPKLLSAGSEIVNSVPWWGAKEVTNG